MATVVFKFAAPTGYTPAIEVFRPDTEVSLGNGVAAETDIPNYYSVSINVGSYNGNVIASLANPDGIMFGSTSDGKLYDSPAPGTDPVILAIYAKTQLIGSGSIALVETRVSPKGFIAFVGEVDTQTLPTVDLTAENIEIAFEDTAKRQIATIANASIVTRTNSSITFTKPSAITASVRRLAYSIRRTSDKHVFHYGVADIQTAAIVRN